jgi:hypothetical protein
MKIKALLAATHGFDESQKLASFTRARSEHEIQSMIFDLLDARLPRYGRRAFAVPNGGYLKSAKTWIKLRAEGARPGVPDFQIPGRTPKGGFGGVVIELKARNGRTSREQWAWLLYYASIGWLAGRCTGFDEAVAMIEAAGYV